MANKIFKNLKWLWIPILLAVCFFIYFIFIRPSVQVTVPTQGSVPNTEEVKGASTGTWYEVYFTNPIIPFNGVYEGGIESHLIEKIDAAKVTIDVAVYEFNIETVAQALIRAEKRGVEVEVVYDNEYSDPDPEIQELKDAGIKAVPDNRSAFMHNKFFVFDGMCIWTGSFNISMNAAYKNNENAIYFCSPEAAKNYDTEFKEMFVGEFGPSSPANTPYPTFTVDGATVENYFAPEDNVMDKVINAVEKAKISIHFMAYSFTDSALADAIMQMAAGGVKVDGIFETMGANTSYSQCKILLGDGLDVRLDGNPATFHHKVIIIDSKIVILGSFNFTSNANHQNDENLLIIYDDKLAALYEQQFQLMEQQAVIPSGNSCTK